jgi:hypothetical protein
MEDPSNVPSDIDKRPGSASRNTKVLGLKQNTQPVGYPLAGYQNAQIGSQ